MVEKAFKVSPDAKLYHTYFSAKEEKNKFHQLARAFFEKHDLIQNKGYYQTVYLAVELTDEQREKYSSQLKKLIDRNNMSYFKKNSPMDKEWQTEVVAHCDMNKLDGTWLWYFPYIGKGSYALWDDGYDNLYGYLSDENKDNLELSDWMIPIKMSEYYNALEERSERNNNE